MNLNRVIIAREGYTILDFISDIGGMQSMLISFFALIIMIWNFHYAENYLVTKIYRLSDASMCGTEITTDKQELKLKFLAIRNVCDYFCEKLPHRFQCCCRHSQ